MAKSKFLVLYTGQASLDAVLGKANLQNAKVGPFAAVVLLGQPQLDVSAVTTKPDAPTYFFGSDEKHHFAEAGPNLICVHGQQARLHLAYGLSMVFYNDALEAAPDSEIPAQDADLFFSHNWPYAMAVAEKSALVGDRKIDTVAQSVRPRYHFCVGPEQGRFHEHPPFQWGPGRSGRIVSLAREGTGAKWFYAFGIDTDPDQTQTGENPYTVKPAKRSLEPEPTEPAPEENGTAPKRARVVAPQDCFFCLSNPRAEVHMIVAIGTHAYLTIAKGPLTQANKFLSFSGHAIITPIEHVPVILGDARAESAKFEASLVSAFKAQHHNVVFFEYSRASNVHGHIQAVPVHEGLLMDQFERALEAKLAANGKYERNMHFSFSKVATLEEIEHPEFLRISVVMDGTTTHFVAPLAGEKAPDLQFPRRVLAYLLRINKRVNWDKCRQTTQQEITDCQRFKDFYREHDITRSAE